MLHPLLFVAVYYLAFAVIFDFKQERFPLFLAAGIFLWHTVLHAVMGGTTTFVANASLLKKVVFPRWLLVFSMVTSEMIHLVLAIPVLFVFMAVYRAPVSWGALAAGLPPVLALHVFLCTGPALLFGCLNVYFRDLSQFIDVAMRLLFFLTPILYAAEMLGDYRWLLRFHPVACQVIVFRGLFLDGVVHWADLGYGALGTAVVFGVGVLVYRRLIGRVAEVI